MKKLYYLMLTIAVFFLFVAVQSFVTNDAFARLHTPQRFDDPSSWQRYTISTVEPEQADVVLTKLDEFVQKHDATILLQVFDHHPYYSTYRNPIIIYLSTGRQARLDQLPFIKVPAIDEFNASDHLYSSETIDGIERELHGVSNRNTIFIGHLPNYEYRLEYPRITIMDSTPEVRRIINQELFESTGYQLEEETISFPSDNIHSRTDLYKETLKIGFRGPQFLVLLTVALGMLLLFWQSKSTWMTHRLFGYSLPSLGWKLVKQMLTPTIMTSVVLFIPLSVYYGYTRLGQIIPVAIAYLPVLFAFLFAQLAVVAIMLLDLKVTPPVAVLNRQKKGWVIGSFAVAFKVTALILLIPVLAFNLLRLGDVYGYYKFQSELKKDYRDIWLLELQPNIPQISEIDINGASLPFDNPETISWMKFFYDTIRDKYPVASTYIQGHEEPDHVQKKLMYVNGNFIRLMGVRDVHGHLLTPDNTEKMVITSHDYVENAENYLKTEHGRADFLGEITEAFAIQGRIEPRKIEAVPVTEAHPESSVLTFNFLDPTYAASGWIDEYILVVNPWSNPRSISDLSFIGITEEQRQQLLDDVSSLPFSENLQWIRFADFQSARIRAHQEEHIRIGIEFLIMLYCLAVFSFFIYKLLYEWMAQQLAVRYLFGSKYRTNSIPIFMISVLLTMAVSTVLLKTWSNPMTISQLPKVVMIVVVFDLLAFLVAMVMYSKQTLKNLAVRE